MFLAKITDDTYDTNDSKWSQTASRTGTEVLVEFPENSIGLIDHAKASAMVPWCRGARLDLHNWVLGWLLQSPAGHPPNTSAPQHRPGAGAKNHCTIAWCQCCSPRPYPGALSAHLERTPAWPRGCEAWSWYLLLRCIEYMQPLEVVWIHTKICNRTD